MGREQQEIGRESSLKGAGRGEAQEALSRRVELRMVEDARESLGSEKLLEEVVEKGNIHRAMYRVLTNKGAPGVDGMTAYSHNFGRRKRKAYSRSLTPGCAASCGVWSGSSGGKRATGSCVSAACKPTPPGSPPSRGVGPGA